MNKINFTLDPRRESWIQSAKRHRNFPLQNLPFGVFSPQGQPARVGIAIGDEILDVYGISNLFANEARRGAEACGGVDLADLMHLGPLVRKSLRTEVSRILGAEADGTLRTAVLPHLYRIDECELKLPVSVRGFIDFYAGVHHAINVGRLFRPESPLMPNYRYLPVAYNGRASTVRVSGTNVLRPKGQIYSAEEKRPFYMPTEKLDYEVEVAVWVGSTNSHGEPVPIGSAKDAIWGYGLLNDWSARDIQSWEYQPLGPNLSKSFCTSVSPWVVTPEALEPFFDAVPERGPTEPQVLPHLRDDWDQANGALDLEIETTISTLQSRARMSGAQHISSVNTRALYWTFAQMVAHATSNGCTLGPGDLLGSGTVSGEHRNTWGALIEITNGGELQVEVADGEYRTYLEDGDEVTLSGRCAKEGFTAIGFGECKGVVIGQRQSQGTML